MKKIRKVLISIFLVGWICLFHYESLRGFYLSPLLGFRLPKFPLLFPPAGWIMFYEVGASWSTAEVYGVREKGPPELIDPHRIFETRFVGFDNIHRNMMVNVLDQRRAPEFCAFLRRKFPAYSDFEVRIAGYPDLVFEKPPKKMERPLYQC